LHDGRRVQREGAMEREPKRGRLSRVVRVFGLSALIGMAVAAPTAPGWAEDAGFRCALAESAGLSEPDSKAATDLVCQALRRVSGGQGAFDVRLAALGSSVFVTATRTAPEFSVTVRVDAIEEMEVAAQRIAEAVVRGEPFASTQRVGNLLQSETQPALSKKGSLKFLVDVADVESPGHGARSAGFGIGILYAAPRFALPAEMRFAWDSAVYPKAGLSLFSISLGGRAYLSTKDVSPFAGGGLGALRLHAHEGEYPGAPNQSTYFDGESFGVAPYIEVGVEALRLHRARLALRVRVDLPTSALTSPEFPVYSYDDWESGPVLESVYPAESRYVVPVSIGLSVAF
jgi:hypothetical protein